MNAASVHSQYAAFGHGSHLEILKDRETCSASTIGLLASSVDGHVEQHVWWHMYYEIDDGSSLQEIEAIIAQVCTIGTVLIGW